MSWRAAQCYYYIVKAVLFLWRSRVLYVCTELVECLEEVISDRNFDSDAGSILQAESNTSQGYRELRTHQLPSSEENSMSLQLMPLTRYALLLVTYFRRRFRVVRSDGEGDV